MIAVMVDPSNADLLTMPSPVRQILVPGDPVPLGAARNAVTCAAEGDLPVVLGWSASPIPTFLRMTPATARQPPAS